MHDEDLHPSSKVDEEVAIATRMKGKPKKNMSKIKCFKFGEMGHFSSICPNKGDDDKGKKKGKNIASLEEMDDLARRLEEEDFSMNSHFS